MQLETPSILLGFGGPRWGRKQAARPREEWGLVPNPLVRFRPVSVLPSCQKGTTDKTHTYLKMVQAPWPRHSTPVFRPGVCLSELVNIRHCIVSNVIFRLLSFLSSSFEYGEEEYLEFCLLVYQNTYQFQQEGKTILSRCRE